MRDPISRDAGIIPGRDFGLSQKQASAVVWQGVMEVSRQGSSPPNPVTLAARCRVLSRRCRTLGELLVAKGVCTAAELKEADRVGLNEEAAALQDICYEKLPREVADIFGPADAGTEPGGGL